MRIIVGQLRYEASSFYNVVLFNNEKALSWDFSATCFTKIMVVIWVVKPKVCTAIMYENIQNYEILYIAMYLV
jgi:hypothetical protein